MSRDHSFNKRSTSPKSKSVKSVTDEPKDIGNNKLFVTNLDHTRPTLEVARSLEHQFSCVADVVNIDVKQNVQGGYAFAFVQFQDGAAANAVIRDFSNFIIHGKAIKIAYQKSNYGGRKPFTPRHTPHELRPTTDRIKSQNPKNSLNERSYQDHKAMKSENKKSKHRSHKKHSEEGRSNSKHHKKESQKRKSKHHKRSDSSSSSYYKRPVNRESSRKSQYKQYEDHYDERPTNKGCSNCKSKNHNIRDCPKVTSERRNRRSQSRDSYDRRDFQRSRNKKNTKNDKKRSQKVVHRRKTYRRSSSSSSLSSSSYSSDSTPRQKKGGRKLRPQYSDSSSDSVQHYKSRRH